MLKNAKHYENNVFKYIKMKKIFANKISGPVLRIPKTVETALAL